MENSWSHISQHNGHNSRGHTFSVLRFQRLRYRKAWFRVKIKLF